MAVFAEILTIGDELLRGDLADTNGAWLAARLFRLGISVERIVSLGDPLDPLVEYLTGAIQRGRLVLVTGGLGPTEDDRTSEAVARAAAAPLELRQPVLDALHERFERSGFVFTTNNEKQAHLPRGAVLVPNPRGTAPGFMVRAGRARIVCMPGVPSEMKGMFEETVAPLLAQELEGVRPARTRVLRTFGMGESQIDQRLTGLLEEIGGGEAQLSLHYRTSFPENHVMLVVSGGEEARAEELLDRFEEEARRRLGERVVYGVDDTTFSDAVVAALREAGATVALAESCTGGLAADLLTGASGSSAVFELGVVTYSNRFKHRILGVPEQVLEQHGAVSQECVLAMARGVRELAGATFGVAISGIAGPTGGSPDKPVGTVHFALCHEGGARHVERRFPWKERRRIKEISAHVALALVLGQLQAGPDAGGRSG